MTTGSPDDKPDASKAGAREAPQPLIDSPLPRGATAALLALPVALVLLGVVLAAPAVQRAVSGDRAEPARRDVAEMTRPPPAKAGKDVPGRPAEDKTGAGTPPFPKIEVLTGPPMTREQAMIAVTPATPWLKVPATTELTRIGFGSCLDQRFPQPIWRAVLKSRPQLFLMMGDNVYGDIKRPDGRDLVEAYAKQLAHTEFKEARAALPMLGVWDDHDYGLNDGGAAFAHRDLAADLFRAYWQDDGLKRRTGGVYSSRTFGPEGRRVQLIMLDTRSFRSPFKAKGRDTALPGKYAPDPDTTATLLGAEQWAWLEAELQKPADIRLLVSSIQVLSDGHGFERWGNLPAERDRLLALVERTGAKGVVLLSGDRHVGGLYNRPLAKGQILIEITSSSLNRSYGPAKDLRTPELVSELHHAENFGLIEIDWSRRRLTLKLLGMGGEELEALSVALSDLGQSK